MTPAIVVVNNEVRTKTTDWSGGKEVGYYEYTPYIAIALCW